MTVANPCSDQVAAAETSVRAHGRSRLAEVLSRLAARLERGAQARARRKALRMTYAELRRLPREAREDLGIRDYEMSPLISGLVGPPDYWRGHVARGDRR